MSPPLPLLTRPPLPSLGSLHTLYTPHASLLHTTLSLTASHPPPSIPSISLAYSLALTRLHPIDRFLAKLGRDIDGFKWYLHHLYDYAGEAEQRSEEKTKDLEALHSAELFREAALTDLEGVKTGLKLWANDGKMEVLRSDGGARAMGKGGKMVGGEFVRRGVGEGDVGGWLGLSKEQVGWVPEGRLAKMVETQGVVEEVKWRIREVRKVLEGGRRRRTW